VDGATKHRIVIDMSKKKIQIECDDGDIQVHAKSGKISVEAQEISVKGTNIKMEASSVLTLKGNIVNIN
jgi:uncharacterized protein (DUF2345 family)